MQVDWQWWILWNVEAGVEFGESEVAQLEVSGEFRLLKGQFAHPLPIAALANPGLLEPLARSVLR